MTTSTTYATVIETETDRGDDDGETTCRVVYATSSSDGGHSRSVAAKVRRGKIRLFRRRASKRLTTPTPTTDDGDGDGYYDVCAGVGADPVFDVDGDVGDCAGVEVDVDVDVEAATRAATRAVYVGRMPL